MRDKRRTRRRVAADGTAAADESGTADWVLANEAGWGFPHRGVAILAGIVVGTRAVAWLSRFTAPWTRANRHWRDACPPVASEGRGRR